MASQHRLKILALIVISLFFIPSFDEPRQKEWSFDKVVATEGERFVHIKSTFNGPDTKYSYELLQTDIDGNDSIVLKEYPFNEYIIEVSPDMRLLIQSYNSPPHYAAIYTVSNNNFAAPVRISPRINEPAPACHWSPSSRYLACKDTVGQRPDIRSTITFFDTKTYTYTKPFFIDNTDSDYFYDMSWITDDSILVTLSDSELHLGSTDNKEIAKPDNTHIVVTDLFGAQNIEKKDNLFPCIETVYMNNSIFCLANYSAVKPLRKVAVKGQHIWDSSHILIKQSLSQASSTDFIMMNPFPLRSADLMQMNDRYIAAYLNYSFNIYDTTTGKHKIWSDAQYKNTTAEETTVFGPQLGYQAVYRVIEN
jgi:hypothetical protein